MRSWWGRFLAAIAIAASGILLASATPRVGPLARYVQPPWMTTPMVSPSGSHAAFARRSQTNGYFNLVFCPLEKPGCPNPAIRQIKGIGLRSLQWVNDDRVLMTIIESARNDKERSEVITVWAIDKDLSHEAVITSFAGKVPDNFGFSDLIVDLLPDDPNNILALGVLRGGEGASLLKLNVYTGMAQLVARGEKQTVTWATDADGAVRLRWDFDQAKKRFTLYARRGATDTWDKVADYSENDFPDLSIIGMTDRPQVAVVLSNRGSDRIGAYEYDLTTKTLGRPLFQHPKYDLGAPQQAQLKDEHTGRVVGVNYVDDHMKFAFFDAQLSQIQGEIQGLLPGGATGSIVSWSRDRGVFIVYAESASDDGSYYLYRRKTKSMTPFGKVRPQLSAADLAETKAISYKARDGLTIPAYLTLPHGKPAKNLPLVVMPHGGPWARDFIGFDWMVQGIASRGYAVLQMNFRGSTGYGKAFVAAGDGEWGHKMQDDVTDGVMRMIADGIADPERVCIFGASYGGYAALAGGALTPDLYKCVISLSGVSDLPQMLEEAEKEYGRKSLAYQGVLGRVGDRKADRKALAAVSPARLAAQFEAPVLLMHGNADQIASIAHSQRMYQALMKAKKGVRFVELKGEGHNIVNPATQLEILEEIDKFLNAYIGSKPATS